MLELISLVFTVWAIFFMFIPALLNAFGAASDKHHIPKKYQEFLDNSVQAVKDEWNKE